MLKKKEFYGSKKLMTCLLVRQKQTYMHAWVNNLFKSE